MRLERIFQMKFTRITNLITFSKLSFSLWVFCLFSFWMQEKKELPDCFLHAGSFFAIYSRAQVDFSLSFRITAYFTRCQNVPEGFR